MSPKRNLNGVDRIVFAMLIVYRKLLVLYLRFLTMW